MRTIVLTFDNMGEASALQRGTPDPATPLGHDPSVTVALPRLLDELAALRLRATFFVEAINCELNPRAVRAIADAGHELGVHGYRHEPWSQLEAAEERELLDRSTAAFAGLGLAPRGFRPPGGALTSRTLRLLRRRGFTWCSPAGGASAGGAPAGGAPAGGAPADGAPGFADGLATVPFDWELVDAFHLMDRFAGLRRDRGEDPGGTAPGELAERFGRALTEVEGLRTVILHPFLMLDDAWWQGVRRLLALIAGLQRAGEARVLAGGELVRRLGEGAGA